MTGSNAAAQDWPVGPSHPTLEANGVDLWMTTLRPSAQRLAEYRSTLDADEIARAERFVTRELTEAFIAGRGFLRTVLARYGGRQPSAIEFAYGDRGKPSWVGAERDWSFNLSHSHERALLGITSNATIGVDIEYRRDSRDLDGVARRYFSPAEVGVYESLAPRERLTGFYNCWTRKEAYLKAKGGGLSFPLDRFVVSLEPSKRAQLISTELDDAGHPGWWLEDIAIDRDYAAAIVIEGAEPRPLRRYGL